MVIQRLQHAERVRAIGRLQVCTRQNNVAQTLHVSQHGYFRFPMYNVLLFLRYSLLAVTIFEAKQGCLILRYVFRSHFSWMQVA